MNPKYTKDKDGKELLTITEKHDNIMMEWEKPYMEACIEKLNPSGHVLEIGFGLGYSATAIQNYSGVKKHTIIECSPEVWTKVEEFKKGHPNVELIKGRWEDVLRTCGVFDCIFFESEIRRPDGSLYAVTKRLQEEMCRQFFDAFALPIIVLRPAYIVDLGLALGRGKEPLETVSESWIDRHQLAEARASASTSTSGACCTVARWSLKRDERASRSGSAM